MISNIDAKIIYNNNITKLKTFFYKKCSDSDSANELAHITMTKVILNHSKYTKIDGVDFNSWMYKIANNTFLNHIKTNNKIKEDIQDHHKISTNEYSELLNFLKKSLNDLDYEIVEKYFYIGYSLDELSSHLQMDKISLKNKIYYMKNKLKKMLKNHI